MVVKPGYRRTGMGMIPESWNEQPFGTLYLEPSRNGIYKTAEFLGRGTRIVNMKEMFGYEFISGQDMGRVALTRTELTSSALQDGDLLFGRRSVVPAGAGKCSLIVELFEPLTFESSVIRVRLDKQDAYPLFYYYFFASDVGRSLMSSIIAGTNIMGIRASELRDLKIPIPSLGEQMAIAQALSDADTLIEYIEQCIVKKRQIKQGVMREILRPKNDWIQRKLGDLASLQRGASPRPIDSPIWFEENSPIGWVRISDVTRSDMFLRETTQRLSVLGVRNSRRVDSGSLIMSICATVGKPIITQIDTCIHDGFVVFYNPRVDQMFLYYILKCIEGEWSKHGQTGSQMNLNTDIINRTMVSIPKDIQEQNRITDILFSIDKEIAGLETKLIKTRQIKQGMMHNLLTGRIRLI